MANEIELKDNNKKMPAETIFCSNSSISSISFNSHSASLSPITIPNEVKKNRFANNDDHVSQVIDMSDNSSVGCNKLITPGQYKDRRLYNAREIIVSYLDIEGNWHNVVKGETRF
jgi:hypothetical protein